MLYKQHKIIHINAITSYPNPASNTVFQPEGKEEHKENQKFQFVLSGVLHSKTRTNNHKVSTL